MFYTVSEQVLSDTPVSLLVSNPPPISYYSWKVDVVNKKSYFLNWADCPISRGKFTINEAGMGKGSLNFEILDVPIDTQDNIRIYRNGEIFYQGFVKEQPDPEGGKIGILPQSAKFKDTLYDQDFSTNTISSAIGYEDLLQDIFVQRGGDMSISYNPTDVDISSTERFNIEYNDETIKKILDDTQKQFSNRYMGVEQNNFFYVRKKSTNIDWILHSDDAMYYDKVLVTEDDTKIKNTRLQVYQETASAGETNRLGSVGYTTSSTDFPSLSIENRVGIKEGRFTAPKGLNSTAALDYAYKKLQAETVVPTNLKITSLDYEKFSIDVGQQLRVWKPERLIWNVIIDCESTANWSADASNSTIAKKDAFSITANTTNDVVYNYNTFKKWRGLHRLGFYLRSDTMGTHFDYCLYNSSIADIDLGDYGVGIYGAGIASEGDTSVSSVTSTNVTSWDSKYTGRPYIRGVNEWQWISMDVDLDNFNSIAFRSDNSTANYYIDNISLFQYTKKYYDGNVTQIDFDLGSSYVDVQCGELKQFVDQEFFELQKKVQKLEQVGVS